MTGPTLTDAAGPPATGTTHHGRRRGPGGVAVAVASLAAGLGGAAAAQLGMTALYVVTALLVAGAVLVGLRDQLLPPLSDAVARIDPRSFPRRNGRGRIASALAPAATVAGAGMVAWVVAQQGVKAMAALGALLVAAVAIWLLFPLVHDLVTTEPSDVPDRRDRDRAAAPGPVTRPGRLTRAVGSVIAVGGAGMLAWVAAQLGLKGLIALVGVIGLVALLGVVKDRSVFFGFAAVCSLTFVLHKSLGPQDLELSGGAISIYITTFDAVLLLLYGLWIHEGTCLTDVRAAWRERPILRLPLWGALLLLPSLLVAGSPMHGGAELFRAGWMYLLFVYVAVRVRTRRHVWAMLGGLAVFACIELVVVVLQWRTGGVLGLSFLGVPTELGERVTDSSVVGRPFGTIIHPVFMGAVMGSLALVALGVGLTLRRSLTRTAALAIVGVAVVPLYLAHTRASLVAFAVVAVGVVAVSLRRGDLRWSTIGRAGIIGLIGVVVLFPSLSEKVTQNFGTGHFFEEVESRQELNVVAAEMFADHPVLGVGLNNFELEMGPYERFGIIFFDNPVHNLYLLYLSETGVIGFVGLVLVGGGLLLVAGRLARTGDRLYRGVGLGVTGMMAFLAVEELLGFSLRQDIPLAMYWLLAGLAVACTHLAGDGANGGDDAPTTWDRSRRATRVDPAQLAELERSVHDLWAARRTTEVPRNEVGHLAELEQRVGSLVATRRALLGEVLWLDELASLSGDPMVVDTDDVQAELRWLDELMTMGPPTDGPPVPAVTGGGASRRPQRTVRVGAVITCLVVAAAVVPTLASPGRASSTAGLRITFSATERATGIGGIYVAEGDGSGITRITPPDGRVYSWPQWALGGTRIVYTARTGPEGAPEDLHLMNPDGSGDLLISRFAYRIGQPKIDPTGRWLVFTAQTPWFPVVALYRLDLATLEATNLSAVTQPEGAIDADPMLTPRGDQLVFAQSDQVHTQVALMDTDGTDRRLVTDDAFFNTDPDVAPDGSEVAIASYRGAGNPGVPGRVTLVGVKPEDWHLVVRDLRTGQERVLTEGQRCIDRTPDEPCSPDETSAFKPRYTPDGTEIGYNAALDGTRTCLCVIGRDGSNPRALIAPPELALDWFDWVVPTGAPSGAAPIGSSARSSKLLVTRAEGDGPAQLIAASPDLMHREVLGLPAGLEPSAARWTPSHDRVVFTARVPIDPARAVPHPTAPPGSRRREHVTLDSLDPVALTLSGERIDPGAAEQQVFLREADGSVLQLTDPWTEDWRDGVAAGDARSSTDPVISADGSTVLVTNTSTLTGESFLLRIDVATGQVLNLTNGTSGVLPVEDGQAQLSPDGGTVVFTWTEGGQVDVYTMQASDGAEVTALTDDEHVDTAPTFTPDGAAVVFASHRGADEVVQVSSTGLPVRTSTGWLLVRVDLATGLQTVLTDPLDSPTWTPTVAPEGDRLSYVGAGGRTLDLFALSTVPDAVGGIRRPVPLQPDPHANELFVDWR